MISDQWERVMRKLGWVTFLLLVGMVGSAVGKTSNGNDFALYLSEAQTPAEQKELIDDAKGRPHYFRYLRIVALEEGEIDGRPYMTLLTEEPSSYMKVSFTVTKPISFKKLKEAPTSTIGDAVAVTGRIASVDPKKARIVLKPVIIRHKDRLTPKMGKELLYELDPSAICYSFTAVKPGVQLPYKHRDLLEHKERILGSEGKQAWANFLRRELAKRKQAAKK